VRSGKRARGYTRALIFASRNILPGVRPRVGFDGLFISPSLKPPPPSLSLTHTHARALISLAVSLAPRLSCIDRRFVEISPYTTGLPLLSPLPSRHRRVVSWLVQFSVVCRIARFPGLTNFRRPAPQLPGCRFNSCGAHCVYAALGFRAAR